MKLVVDFYLLTNHRVPGSYSLDLCKGKRLLSDILHFPDIGTSVHGGIDKRALALEDIHHSGVERTFSYIVVDIDIVILVSLPLSAPVLLRHIAGPPRCVKVMNSNNLFLHVQADTHFAGAADQNANFAGIELVTQLCLFFCGICLMDEGYFFCRYALQHEHFLDIIVYGDVFSCLRNGRIIILRLLRRFIFVLALRRSKVAENKLCRALFFGLFPYLVYLVRAKLDFASGLIR